MGLREIIDGELLIEGKPRWTADSVHRPARSITVEDVRAALDRQLNPEPRPRVWAVSKTEFDSLVEAGWIDETGRFVR